MDSLPNWTVTRWDSNKGEMYTAYGRQDNPTEEREGTEYWLISNQKEYLKDMGLEEYQDCIKIWQCDSYEEARALTRILCKFDTEREKAGNKYQWVIWLCIIVFGWIMLGLGSTRANVQAIKKGYIERHGMTYSVEYESGTFSPPDPPDDPF